VQSAVTPAPRRRWRWVLAFAGAGLLLLVLAIWEFCYRQPPGEGPAGPAVPSSEFTEVWTTRPVLVVGLGDSITAGLGARPGYAYFDRVLANPRDEWADMTGVNLRAVLPNLTATNLAMSGSTSLDHMRRQLPRVPAADTNTLAIVFLTTGGNDIIHNYGRTAPREGAMYGATWEEAEPWISNFSTRLDDMLEELNRRFHGGCHIFLADIYDPTDGTGDARRVGLPRWEDGGRVHAAYNAIIHAQAAARTNVHLVELHAMFLGHGLGCRRFWSKHYRGEDPHYWYWVNLEDPNERGYDAIRRQFLRTLADSRGLLK
jgi:lysophospholipase L1-like esterase